MKKPLLSTTVLTPVFEEQGANASKETIRKVNDLIADDEKIGGGEIPQSVEMMSSLLSELLVKRYDLREEDIHYYVQTFSDESFDIVYHPGYEDIKEGEPGETDNAMGDAYDDPDYYDRVNAMLNDIVDQADERLVRIVPDTLSLSANTKMGLFDAIMAYMKEEGLNTPDMISFSAPGKDELDVANPVMAEMVHVNAALARRIMNNDAESRDALFIAAEARPFASMVFYEASLLKGVNADLSISMDHIRRTICQEDGLAPKNPRLEPTRFGGMN